MNNQQSEPIVPGDEDPLDEQQCNEEGDDGENMMEQYQQEYENNDDYYNDYDIEQYGADFQLAKTKSVDNSQYNLNELFNKILQECQDIDKYTDFGSEWSLLYYSACGWKKDLCQELIGLEQKHKKIINYNPNMKNIKVLEEKGECLLCCEEDKTIIRGLCGDQFCEDCWLSHLFQRLKTNYIDPFPACINDGNCLIRVAPKMCFYFAQKEPQFKKLFFNVLCRSYATFNSFVKVCKGRPGVDCNRVFAVTKMLGVIECDTCGNIVCPRCGQLAHGVTYCYDLSNWRKITQQSIEFVEFYNYKQCPNCKEAVERRSGCNSIVCSCKQQFCFVCGEKWLPNHSHHGDQSCYRYKQIMELKQQQKAKKQLGKNFYLKVEGLKSELDILFKSAERIMEMRAKLKKQIIPLILKNYHLYENQLACIEEICTVCMKSLYFLRGWKMGLYFRPNQLEQIRMVIMSQCCSSMTKFLIDFLDEHFKVMLKYGNNSSALLPQESALYCEENKKQFVTNLENQLKKMKNVTESASNIMLRSD